MPTEIVTPDGERFEFRPSALPPLEADSVRIRVEFASPKHGTESHLIAGSAFDTKRWDGALRMFLPREPGDAPSRPPERRLGNIVVGVVTETGAAEQRLDEEYHLNRPTIVGSQAVWHNPDRSHPLWTEERARQAAIDLFAGGRISGEPIVTPIVPFREAPEAFREMIHAPERCIKIGVAFQ